MENQRQMTNPIFTETTRPGQSRKILYSRVPVLILMLMATSCGVHDTYYIRVRNNISEFKAATDYISKNRLFEIQDSINLKKAGSIHFSRAIPLYRTEIRDSTIMAFMDKFHLDRIILEKRNDTYYNSTLIFHRDYAPFFGRLKTIDYDFGKSPLRDRINQGAKKDGGCFVKIIDSLFIYSVNRAPAFGA